jgi:hypothetical protein
VADAGKIHSHVRAGVLACAGSAVLALAPTTLADTYRPDKRNDNGAGGLSLREAVIRANDEVGNDRIVLEGGETYTLSIAGTDENAAATGDLDINGDSLRIQSSGKPAIIDADDVDRVFDVGPLSPATAVFQRLIITGGSTPDIGARER